MKIQLLKTCRDASNQNLVFHKGKTYDGIVATNQPKSFRLVKNGVRINKIFASRANGDSMLLNKNDFKIVKFAPFEKQKIKDELTISFLAGRIKPKHEKLICPRGLKLREGFRVFTDKEYDNFPEIHVCQMGVQGEKCGKNTFCMKEFKRPGKKTIRIGRCMRHGTMPENLHFQENNN